MDKQTLFSAGVVIFGLGIAAFVLSMLAVTDSTEKANGNANASAAVVSWAAIVVGAIFMALYGTSMGLYIPSISFTA